MPKVIVLIDGVVIKEVQLSKERTTVGRRPYNDIVIDNLAVSGEHAAVQMIGTEVYLEDLDSTNGTFVNGKQIKKHLLAHDDVIDVGKYTLKFVSTSQMGTREQTVQEMHGDEPTQAAPLDAVPDPPSASIKVISGSATGREVPLVKVVTTIGKPGIGVAALTRRPQGYVVSHVEGTRVPLLNGVEVGVEPQVLRSGDVLELAGTQMQFIQSQKY